MGTTINVDYSSEEIATEQVEAEMKQRVFGIIPNFYVVYEPSPEPLTTKLKFRLAFKEVGDPITAVEIALLSGAQQAEIPQLRSRSEKALASGAEAAKVCGAGGGGCIAFLCAEGRKQDVERALTVEEGTEILNWKISREGLMVKS